MAITQYSKVPRRSSRKARDVSMPDKILVRHDLSSKHQLGCAPGNRGDTGRSGESVSARADVPQYETAVPAYEKAVTVEPLLESKARQRTNRAAR
jgi:hypothetical protein